MKSTTVFFAENLKNLRLVGLGVFRNLLPRQRRPRRGAARRADRAGNSDQENDGVAEILKMSEFAQQDGVPRCRSGAVGSKPAFTRSGFPEVRSVRAWRAVRVP